MCAVNPEVVTLYVASLESITDIFRHPLEACNQTCVIITLQVLALSLVAAALTAALGSDFKKACGLFKAERQEPSPILREDSESLCNTAL